MLALRTIVFVTVLALPAIAWAGSQYQLQVHGLACPFCAYGIEKQLHKLDGVEAVEVDIAKGIVTVGTRGERMLAEPEVREAVERAGFTLNRLERVEAGP